jgi:predicted anti-sigma-YlaC factor YlaD
MLTCRELVQSRASDYLDSQLNWRARAGVRFHLLFCDQCRRFMHQLALVRGLLAGWPEPEPEETEVRLLAERLYREHRHRAGHLPE